MRSAVRLFCFLIGMVFQQIPALLLHEFLLLVLITCMGFHFQRRIEGEGFHFQRKIEPVGFPLSAWKTPSNHTPLWNKRFTDSDDSGVGGYPRVQPDAKRPLTGR